MLKLLRKFLPHPQYHHLNEVVLSRQAFAHNYHFFAQLQPNCAVAPVLKSNAYGHGLIEVAKISDNLHAPFLVVDSLHEAYQLSRQRIQTPILIMGYTDPRNFGYKKLPFATVVSSWEMIAYLAKHQPQMPLHLKIDTGMNRQGIKLSELPALLTQLKTLPKLNLLGVCSHFADADNPSSLVFTHQQLRQFESAVKMIQAAGFNPKWRHIAATAGALKISSPVVNLIRLGIGFYGISPLSTKDSGQAQLQKQLQPALQLESTIAQLKTVSEGEQIGYGLSFTALKKIKIAVLPIGYFDGVDRRLSNQGVVSIGTALCPIVGRMSMNMMTIDVTNAGKVKVGDRVVIFSHDPQAPHSVWSIAHTIGTIPYEVLVHIAQSTHRRTV
jgi:alanine racemase